MFSAATEATKASSPGIAAHVNDLRALPEIAAERHLE